MQTAKRPSNKAKIARRVVEVLEYFDDTHRDATVMDIVRRYDRPQSSTSELLSSLVELGLLAKDPYSRTYRLTPRSALLGTGGQSGVVRDGRLVRLTDRLTAQTGLSVAIFAMVGLKAQIVSWRRGARCSVAAVRNLFGGMTEALGNNVAGHLLLSTIAQPRCEGVIRRLNAEAADARKFPVAELTALVSEARDSGVAHGGMGFGSQARCFAALLPADACDQPLAVGFVFGPEDNVNPEALEASLGEAIRQVLGQDELAPASIEQLQIAAA